MNFNDYLQSNGWDRAALTPVQLATLQAAWRATARSERIDGEIGEDGRCTCETEAPPPDAAPAPAPPDGGEASYAALMAGFRREEARERAITALAASALRDHPDQADKIDQITRLAFSGKWNAKDTELALLRGLRQSAPSPLSRGGREVSAKTVEAALALSAGLSEEAALKGYGAQALEQAHSAFKGGLSLGELLVSQARRNGYADASIRGNALETLRAAFRTGQPMSAGFSNVSLPGILSNVANKFIRQGFDYGCQEWRKVCTIRSTNDFKQVSTYGLIGDYDFIEVAKDGRIQHAVPGELDYTNQVKMYARMLTITYVDLVNDDLGAFGQKGTKLGTGAIRAWNKKFWAEWNRLSGFNTAGLGNYDDGADSAFGAEGLDAAVQLFRAQKIPLTDATESATDPLGVRPKKLVVPPKWHMPALRLMRSQKVHEDSVAGDENVWSGMFEVVAPDYMHEASLGGVDTQWSLIADPNELPCIEAAFLFGQQAPTIENVDVDADQLGVGLRGYWANGVNRQEHRARVVMKGKA